MGAKFIHPIESEWPKNVVAIRNTTATMIRRSAGIISQNLSARYDMQSQIWEPAFERVRLQRSEQIRDARLLIPRRYRAPNSRHPLTRHTSAQNERSRYVAAPSALLRRAFRRLAALR